MYVIHIMFTIRYMIVISIVIFSPASLYSERLHVLAEIVYPESQCVFGSGCTIIDKLFVVLQLQEKFYDSHFPFTWLLWILRKHWTLSAGHVCSIF